MGMKIKTKDDLKKIKEKGLKSIYPDKIKIIVGMATCGLATGAGEVFQSLSQEVEKQKLDFIVSQTGCLGFCQREPLAEVRIPGRPAIIYQEMTAKKSKELLTALTQKEIKKEWAMARSGNGAGSIKDSISEGLQEIPPYDQLPFFKKQQKVALRNCGFIDPDNIEEYIAQGGYFSLEKALRTLNPEEIINEIKESGLRGRGGAGFPTGLKWSYCRKAPGEIKYVICNGDEGDPGAYMDRSVLEGDPHSVLEGMLIGGYAIGAKEGYIYVRAEYPLAIKKLKKAIQQAKEYGLLGENILGTDFSFQIKLNRGGGAFVCGEETALMASIEGRVGEPRLRPPYPAERGLWDKPTNINNVETWANVPVIIERGSDWFSQIGTEKSKGTKVFSLVGKVKNTGLLEVPMGITLKEIIFEIGEGILNNKKFKAVQTGGPSGGCIPAELIDLKVDYEELTQAGSMMGSGGMIVMDENTCMVDVARYFLSFLKDESCGKCTSCREGIIRLYQILTDICEGKGKEGDIELLEDLSSVVQSVSLCGLGGTAPNPVLSTIRYFRDEYQAHIKDKKCPAGVCKELIQYFILADKCTGCILCAKECPEKAISGERKKPHLIEQKRCIKCGVCFEVCNYDAVVIK
jgi:NADH:ubiquinone oxidoreductase subunit F (NADH-binding)/Pyruvate/2-oxoacid:ferredoxin oxidoreductase delta subunit/(2Fe-2S) ferredoxin